MADPNTIDGRLTVLERAPRKIGGVGDPNGVQDAPMFSVYDELDGADNLVRQWVKGTPLGTLTGWT